MSDKKQTRREFIAGVTTLLGGGLVAKNGVDDHNEAVNLRDKASSAVESAATLNALRRARMTDQISQGDVAGGDIGKAMDDAMKDTNTYTVDNADTWRAEANKKGEYTAAMIAGGTTAALCGAGAAVDAVTSTPKSAMTPEDAPKSIGKSEENIR